MYILIGKTSHILGKKGDIFNFSLHKKFKISSQVREILNKDQHSPWIHFVFYLVSTRISQN